MAYRKSQQERIKLGLCALCGEPRPENNKSVCSKCSKRSTDFNRKRAEANSAIGLCARCRTQALPGLTVCSFHHQRRNGYERKREESSGLTAAQRTQIWRREHPGYHATAQHKYSKNHPERIAATNKAQYSRLMSDPVLATRLKQRKRNYSQENRQAIRQYQRTWEAANKTRLRERRRNWYQHNIHRERTRSLSDRRKRRNLLIGSHTFQQWIARVDYHGWRCLYCGTALTEKTLTKDHVIPISKGGTDFASNLVPACGSCNSGKCNKRSYIPPGLFYLKLAAVNSIKKSTSATIAAS